MLNFMKWRWVYFLISGLVIIPGLISLVVFGLRPAIDFTGGALLEVSMVAPLPSSDEIMAATTDLVDITQVQVTAQDTAVLRSVTLDDQQKNQVLLALQSTFADKNVQEVRFETVGPTLGKELITKTLVGVVLAASVIMIYVARQFKELRYGVSAIISMLHDSLVLLGFFSILGRLAGVEVDVLFVTALLTTLSFSVHDTIVVYDRIRELKQLHPKLTLEEVINAAVLQTLSRSLNNSLTIIFMLTALVLLGGSTIKWFAVALLVGAITGTYSSTFTAAPLLLVWADVQKWWQHRRRKV